MIEIKATENIEILKGNILEEDIEEIKYENTKEEQLLKMVSADTTGLDMDEKGILRIYIRDICKYPLLSAKEEKEIVKKIREGDEDAKALLINSNLRLVVSIARKYSYTGLTMLDVIQEGNLGLMRAIETFSLDKEVKFSTYAYWWIKQAITRAVADKSRSIRLPVHYYEKMYKVRKALSLIESIPSNEPREKRLAEITGFTEKEIRQILQYFEETISLNSVIGEDGDSELIDFVENDDNTFNIIEKDELKRELNNIIDTKLTEKEADVIRKRFGMNTDHCMTLEEIGNQYNVTRERIRQIEGNAIRKLRNPRIMFILQDYLVS